MTAASAPSGAGLNSSGLSSASNAANTPKQEFKSSSSGSITSGGTPATDNKRKLEGDLNPKLKKTKKVFEKGSVDLERLAEGLQRLGEDDLLGVVQMVTDNKTSDMYIKNDIDEGEFHMDLYTLPDSLLRSLWDYVKKRTDV